MANRTGVALARVVPVLNDAGGWIEEHKYNIAISSHAVKLWYLLPTIRTFYHLITKR